MSTIALKKYITIQSDFFVFDEKHDEDMSGWTSYAIFSINLGFLIANTNLNFLC